MDPGANYSISPEGGGGGGGFCLRVWSADFFCGGPLGAILGGALENLGFNIKHFKVIRSYEI